MPVSSFAPALALAFVAPLLLGCSDEAVSSPPACGYGEKRAAVVTELAFTREEPKGVAPGFDLDSRVSDAKDGATCGKADFTSPDGAGGIDNQLTLLLPEIESRFGNAVDGLVQSAINNGELVILIEMEGVDDFSSDSCVDLNVEVGEKDVPSLGTDGLIEAWQTYDPDPTSEHSRAEGAHIEDGLMTAGPFELGVPIAIFDVAFTLHLHNALFRFTIDEDGLMHGFLGGGIVPDEVIDGVKDGAGLADLVSALRVVMNALTDLAQDGDGKCRELSAALRFSAAPAFIRR
jgi:hypothetical protein